MGRLTREDFLTEGPKLKRQEITVKIGEKEGTLLIREFNGLERKATEMRLAKAKARDNTAGDLPEEVACMCVIDDDGRPFFDATEKALLQQYSGRVMSDIFVAILTLSGMTEEAQKVAKEELEKNPQS
jgi:hypothetical protein